MHKGLYYTFLSNKLFAMTNSICDISRSVWSRLCSYVLLLLDTLHLSSCKQKKLTMDTSVTVNQIDPSELPSNVPPIKHNLSLLEISNIKQNKTSLEKNSSSIVSATNESVVNTDFVHTTSFLPENPYVLTPNYIIKNTYADWLKNLKAHNHEEPFCMLEKEEKIMDYNLYYDQNLTYEEKMNIDVLRRYSNSFLLKKGVITVDAEGKPLNFVDASYVGDRFISASAPPINNFRNWYHLLYEKCDVVVMLTDYIESGRTKANKYLPNDINVFTRYDDYEVKGEIIDQDTINDITITKLTIRKYGITDLDRTIYHIHYRRWTDHHIPNHKEFQLLIILYKKYTQMQTESFIQTKSSIQTESYIALKFKTLVHCSAGVGRSGTFLTIQNLLQDIQNELIRSDSNTIFTFDIVDKIRQLRQYRFGMVQNSIQLEFIYNYIRDAFINNEF